MRAAADKQEKKKKKTIYMPASTHTSRSLRTAPHPAYATHAMYCKLLRKSKTVGAMVIWTVVVVMNRELVWCLTNMVAGMAG